MTTDLTLGRYGAIKKLGGLPIKRLNGTVVFLISLGSVGRIKKGWQNYPQGSPIKGHQKTGKSMKMKVKQIQPTPPPTLI